MINNKVILKAVQEQLGKDIIMKDDILSITKLDLSKKSLTEVSDLRQFGNLETLILTENCLVDLSPISELTSLKELRAGNDPFLSDKEKAARKGKNHFEDYSFLKKLTNLTHVCFTDTDIDNIEFVRKLPNLLEFWAYSNPIKDISPLEYCRKLYKVYFFNCPITDISVCERLPELCGIAINCTGVSDLTPIKNHVDFTYLDAHDAKVFDLSPIKDMRKMIYLTLENNHITDITPLLEMQELKWLTLGANRGLSFDNIISVVPNLKGLVKLSFAGNEYVGIEYSDEQKKNLEEKLPLCEIKYTE